jgi:hypothetical protein
MDTIAEESSRWGMDATLMDDIYLKRACFRQVMPSESVATSRDKPLITRKCIIDACLVAKFFPEDMET